MKEALEGWKETDDYLWEMRIENIVLSNANSMKDNFSIMHLSSENALHWVEHFYPTMHISQELVCPYHKIVNGEPVSVIDKSYV